MGKWLRRFVSILAGLWLFHVPAARAEWVRAESPNFVVFSQGSEGEARRRAALLEDYDQLLRLLTGTRAPPGPGKLNIYMARGIDQLRIVRPGLGSSAAGFYSATPTGIAAFADERARLTINPDQDRLQVLFHEYAHHFMMQYFPGAYPPWYVEGFAEYMMNARFDEEYVEYGGIADDRGYQLTMGGEWLDMDRVLFEPDRLRGADVFKFYAQSWITVHYIFRDSARRAALTDYLTAYGRGEDARAAFERAFGMSPDRFGGFVRTYASRRIPVTRLTRASVSAPPHIAVTRLPRSAEDLLLLDAAMKINPSPDLAADLLARVRREVRAFPDDPYAKRVLARAEAFYGDGGVADRLLEQLLAAAPNDSELLYLRGMRHLIAGRAADEPQPHLDEAQRWFVRAYRSDPNHFPTLASYAESLGSEENYISDNTMNILIRAHQLAPQVQSIRLDAAVMMMNRDQFEPAQALLAPLAIDAHSEISENAQRLLEQARNRQRPGMAEADPPEE